MSVALLAPLKPFSSGMVHANESSLQQHIQLKLLQTKKDIAAIAKEIEEITIDFSPGYRWAGTNLETIEERAHGDGEDFKQDEDKQLPRIKRE